MSNLTLDIDQERMLLRVAQSLRLRNSRAAAVEWSDFIQSLRITIGRLMAYDVSYLSCLAIIKSGLANGIASTPEELLRRLDLAACDSQLGNAELKKALQFHQKTLKNLSEMNKLLFETAMKVIFKLGG